MQAARGASLTDRTIRLGRRFVMVLTVAAGVVVVDVVTKTLAVAWLSDRAPVELVEGILRLRLVRNPGAAFGMAQGMTVVLTAVAVVVIAVILRLARRLGNTGWALSLGLVLGGAVGNLTDRVFRSPGPLRGHVIDFLELPRWPVFNVADMAIVCGAAAMVLLSLRGVGYDGDRPG